jgi:hypothetical protein
MCVLFLRLCHMTKMKSGAAEEGIYRLFNMKGKSGFVV